MTQRVSAIIPAYNAARTLEKTLQAIRAADDGQDREFLEVIVVDDCSTDETTAIAERFADRVLRLERNGGAAIARNAGAREAGGDILFFLDADVLVDVGTFTELRTTFSSAPAPDAVVGHYRPQQPLPGFYARFQNYYTFYNHDRCSPDEVSPISWFWTACGAVKKNAFLHIGGFREVYRGASAEDMDLGYRLAEEHFPIVLNKKLSITHVHDHSFRSIMKNNFKKAAAWGELYLRKMKEGKRHAHGFTSQRNFSSLSAVAVTALAILLSPLQPLMLLVALTAMAAMYAINRDFYRFLATYENRAFVARAFLFHQIATFMIGLGGCLAIIRFLTGKQGDR